MKRYFLKTLLLAVIFVLPVSFKAYADPGWIYDVYYVGEEISGNYSKQFSKEISVDDQDLVYGVYIYDGSQGSLECPGILVSGPADSQEGAQEVYGVGAQSCNFQILSDIVAKEASYDEQAEAFDGMAWGLFLDTYVEEYEGSTTNMTVGSVKADSGNNAVGVVIYGEEPTRLTTGKVEALSSTSPSATTRGMDLEIRSDTTIITNGYIAAGNALAEESEIPESIGVFLKYYDGIFEDITKGDISGDTNGLVIRNNNGSDGSIKIICAGTISGGESAIKMMVPETDGPGDPEIDLTNTSIIVFGLEGGTDGLVSFEDDITIKGNLNDVLSYIIKDGGSEQAYSRFTVGDGNTVDADGTVYQTGKALVATKITVAQGYSLSSNKESTLVDNGDGTYTLTIPQEGGIVLTATMIPVPPVTPDIPSYRGGGSSAIVTPIKTGTQDDPVRDGKWQIKNGKWTYTTNAQFSNTWGYIGGADPASEAHWYYFDADGNMVTGWQFINGYWYYFSEAKDATEGSLLMNTVTSDGYFVGPDGRWVPAA